MNTKYFEYCLKIAELQSINKAASALYLSQPYLSGCLKSLESELGFSVFSRSSSGIVPTPKGQIFLRLCREIVGKLEEIQQLADRVEEPPLSLASLPLSYVMNIFLDFTHTHPLTLPDTLTEYASPLQLFTSVGSGKYRMALVLIDSISREKTNRQLAQLKLHSFPIVPEAPYYVAFPHDHPFSGCREITLEDLMQHPMVYYMIPRDDLMQFLGIFRMSAPPANSIAATNRGQYFDAMSSGHYYAIMSCWRFQFHPELQYVPITHVQYAVTLNCVHREGYKLNSRERLFLQTLHDRMLSDPEARL